MGDWKPGHSDRIRLRSYSRRRFLGEVATAALATTALGCAAQSGPQPVATKQAPAAQTTAVPQEKPRLGGILTAVTDTDPPNLDLHQNTGNAAYYPLAPCFSMLVQYDPFDPNKVIPDLAERWAMSPDGKTWTFYLRKGVKFHHGKAFKAEDIKASFERIINPPKGVTSPRKQILSMVDGIETPDDYTVRFVLKQRSAAFLATVAMGWNVIYPKDILEAKGDMTKDVVGTGPFKFKEYIRGMSFELVKNQDYHVPGKPYLDGMKFFVMPDQATAVSALISGQVLLFQPPVVPEFEQFKRQLGNKAVVDQIPGLTAWDVSMNVQRKPWNDPRVQRAVSLAYDRPGSIKVLTQGFGAIGTVMHPNGQWALPPEELAKMPGYGPNKDADIAEAKKLLAEAGYANGFKTRTLSRSGAMGESLAIYTKDQLAKIGIDATPELVEAAVFSDRMNRRDFDVQAYAQAYPFDDPDAVFAQSFLCKATRNYSGVCLSELDTLFQQQTQAMESVERRKIVWEMEKKALQAPVKVLTLWRPNFLLYWSKVRNAKIWPNQFGNGKSEDIWLAPE